MAGGEGQADVVEDRDGLDEIDMGAESDDGGTELDAESHPDAESDPAAEFGEFDDDDAAARAEEALSRFLPAAQVGIIRAHDVTALVVCHEGAQWLPRTLAGLAAQSRRPDRSIGVDAGSTDGSAALLRETLATVVASEPVAGLAGALAAGCRAGDDAREAHDTRPAPDTEPVDAQPGETQPDAEPAYPQPAADLPADVAAPAEVAGGEPVVRWYWIVHDDSAPAPDCLERLLEGADRNPAAHVLIPKTVAWSDPTRLVGIGSRWAPGQPVLERLDPGERDMGQYDVDRAVYTGNSAGMLVRADVWEQLGGMDPLFGGWAGPTDLCRRVWGSGGQVVFIPQGVLAHRQAGERGARPATLSQPSPRRVARKGQLLLDLTQAPTLALPWRWVRGWLSTVVRAVALLLTREPEEATAELAGAWAVLAHPGRIRAGRHAARRAPVTSLVRPPHVRAHRGMALGHSIDAWQAASRGRSRAGAGMRRAAWRPLSVAGALAVAALVLAPSHLLGSGSLRGGGLLPAPDAHELLAAYLASWQDVRFGMATAQPAYLPILAAGSVPLLGSVDLLMRVLFALAVPLAFLSAYVAVGSTVVAYLRTALALAWALLPAGVAAVSGGRISTLVLLLLGPLAARLAATALARPDSNRPDSNRPDSNRPDSNRSGPPGSNMPGSGPPRSRIRPAIAAGTVLGLIVAFAPMVYVLSVCGAVVAWLLVDRTRRVLRPAAIMFVVSAIFLLPWLPRLVSSPWLLLSDLGRNDPTLGDPAPTAWALSPGGPSAVLWAGVPLLVVTVLAVVVLTPTARMLTALAAALGLLAGVAWAGRWVPELWPQVEVAALWPGQSVLFASGVLLLLAARVVVQRGRGSRIASGALLVCVAVLAAGWSAAPSTMTVSTDSGIPAVVALDVDSSEHPRALVLAREGSGVRYAVATGPQARLGDADALAAPNADPVFTDAVQGLVSGAGGDVERELGGRGIRYVIFNGPQADQLVADLDASVGLRRLASSERQSLWLVAGQPVRAELLAPVAVPLGGQAGGTAAPGLVVPVFTRPTSIDVVLHPQAPVPRVLVIAERAESGWRGELAGVRLELTANELGMLTAPVDATGALKVGHVGLWPLLAVAHLLVLAALAVLALPKRRPVDPDEEAAA